MRTDHISEQRTRMLQKAEVRMLESHDKPEALQVQPVECRSCAGVGTVRAGSTVSPGTQRRHRVGPWLLPGGAALMLSSHAALRWILELSVRWRVLIHYELQRQIANLLCIAAGLAEVQHAQHAACAPNEWSCISSRWLSSAVMRLKRLALQLTEVNWNATRKASCHRTVRTPALRSAFAARSIAQVIINRSKLVKMQLSRC